MSSAVAQQCDPRCADFLHYVAKHYGCCAPHMAAQRLYYSGSEEAWATAVDPWEVCSRRISDMNMMLTLEGYASSYFVEYIFHRI